MKRIILAQILVFASRIVSNKRNHPLISSFANLPDEKCTWKKRENAPEVYFINMDISVERRVSMERHLTSMGMIHHRVRGNPWQQIYIPNDLLTFWTTAWCKSQTGENITSHSEVLKNTSSHLRKYTSIMSGLCGRGKDKFGKEKNTLKELGCTTSHLLAMHRAIYSNSSSRYAIIVEDDVKFPFDVDYELLTQSAPEGFGILQLFNSNKHTMTFTWTNYLKNKDRLWYLSENLMYWSTCGYLIDRVVMKPIVDQLVYHKDGWQHFKVIAGISGPCAPPECCSNGTESRWGYYGKFDKKAPCVLASFGFQADSFLYSLAPTYMLGIPLIANGKGGDASTFHQDHVESLHRAAFRKQRQIINELLLGKVSLPSFAKPACQLALNESQI